MLLPLSGTNIAVVSWSKRQTGANSSRFSASIFHTGKTIAALSDGSASHLKNKFGTGVFVICGQDSGHGGIYDY
jgi:hypothetical protein